jgi:hypothetical protein
MINLIPPEGVTDKELEGFLSSVRKDAKEGVRQLLASGAGEAEVADYMASLGPEPEDEIAPPEGPPTTHQESPSHPAHKPQEPAARAKRATSARPAAAHPDAAPDRLSKRRRGQVAKETLESPPGVQGANYGYWQTTGVTRAGAKRSKRP